jgi:mannose-6-phosphate isomerase-like protein (cupin superfamily)
LSLAAAMRRKGGRVAAIAEFDPDPADPACSAQPGPIILISRRRVASPKHEVRPMIVHDLSTGAVSKMIRSDLARATEEPPSQIEPFDFHGCICGVASFIGRPPWEFHSSDDELLHVLAGSSQLTVRQGGEELVRTLRAGDLVIIPKGCWHRNAPEGVTMLHMPPARVAATLGLIPNPRNGADLWRLATTATHPTEPIPAGCGE